MGGWISDQLIKRGIPVDRARKIVMGLAAVLTMVAPLVVWVDSVALAIFMMSIIMFAHGFWITNYITVISEMFGSAATATVVGLSGTAGAVAGLLLNPAIGWVAQEYSYTPLWIISGIMYPLAFVLFVMTIKNIRLLDLTSITTK
jgi:ACS family hexuronate transporter-like MFS transporter